MKQIIKTICAMALTISMLNAQNYKVYTGLLHGHSSISDGSGTPEEAFKMAKDAGLNFFALTEHNHDEADGSGDRNDGILISKDHNLYNGTSIVNVTTTAGKKVAIKPLIKAAKDASTATFLALYGQEFSTISSGNHVNVIGIDEVMEVENGNYKALADFLDKLKADGKKVPVLQMNHPGVTADLFAKNPDKKSFNDYGVDEGDLGPHFKNVIARLDPYVSLIEILSGPALKKEIPKDYFYDKTHENDYFFYLKQGFHISPSAGQDNHYKNWGTGTNARVGVLASALTEKDLFDAFNNNRTFATDDKNLLAYFKANGNYMGSSFNAPEDAELDIEVTINDTDEPNEDYTINVYASTIKAENSLEATKSLASEGLVSETEVTGNKTIKIKGVAVPEGPSFVYIKVIQADGNRVWTAPVWLNYNTPAGTVTNTNTGSTAEVFYWSKAATSKVYHKAGCSSVGNIKAENLEQGTTPPSGRTLHNCNNQEENH